jgi:hypothetical protein
MKSETAVALARSRFALGAALFAICAGGAVLAAWAVGLELSDVASPAVAIGLTLTATLLVWRLGSRRGVVPGWAPLVTLSIGVALASRLPDAPLVALGAIWMVVELALLVLIAVRLPALWRAARAARPIGPVGALEAGFLAARLPPRMAAIMASELAVLWLALTGWFRRADRNGFSMLGTHWLSVATILGLLIVAESAALHLLLAMWSETVAWIASASSAYALLWLIADSQAIRLFPVAISDQTLWLRVGVRWRAAIVLSEIKSISRISEVPAGATKLALLEPTVLVELHRSVQLRGPFGIERSTTQFALTIDDPERFIAASDLC